MRADAPVSVMLLARDETARLEALLPELAFAAEVVVVWDDRGDPRTRATAERAGARVFTRPWAGFGAQRRFALERCTQPWVLWVDADERPDTVARDAIARAVRDPAGPPAWTLERVNFFLGGRIRYCGWGGERLVRLFRRDAARFADADLVHEEVAVPGTPGRLAGVLEHRSYETWADCVVKRDRYAEANAEKAFRAGRRAGPLDGLVRAPFRFLRQYVLQLGVLDGWRGLVLCAFAASQVRRKYDRLHALGRTAR
jgi:glycosyltransferase involved in cell wall biosynthesis